jgi:hypothetical protein
LAEAADHFLERADLNQEAIVVVAANTDSVLGKRGRGQKS